MKTQHTPTPWHVEPLDSDEAEGTPTLVVCSKTVGIVAWVRREEGLTDEDRADAEFIVRACNAHDALVEAVKLAAEWSEDGSPDSERGPLEMEFRRKALAALQLAKGE